MQSNRTRNKNILPYSVWCKELNCHYTTDNRTELVEHMSGYRHGYTKKQANEHIKRVVEQLANDERQEQLKALGYIVCPECREPRDPQGFAVASWFHRSEPVCVDCQPIKVIDGIGAIYREHDYGTYGYTYRDGQYPSSGIESVDDAERRMRRHVADIQERPEIILDENDQKDYARMLVWQARMKAVIGAGHQRPEADQIVDGFRVCAEHEACQMKQAA